MRIVHLNHERTVKCQSCKCKLAYNPKDLNVGPFNWYVSCPNCGRTVTVDPPKRFIRYREMYMKSIRDLGKQVDF